MTTNAFEAHVPDETLDDLKDRLRRTRWPDQVAGQDWRQGTELGFLRRLCEHWSERFAWRAAEARLNAFPQARVVVDGVGLHVLHARSDRADAVPLLLANGWPSSIFEYLDIVPRLGAGGFHVVAPALPGYGFSDRPTAPGMNATRIADLYASLMTALGHDRFLMHGSDLGAGVAEQLRRRHPDRLIGVHFSNVYWGYPRPDDPTPDEQAYFGRVQAWQFAEGAYAMMHGTKPQTASYGLTDSPSGLAGWIVEKFRGWSDGDFEQVFGLDGICANITLYWATGTIGSSMRLYAEAFADAEARKPLGKSPVPVGVIVFPKDILPAPRAWGERWLNLVHWTEAPRGGHFPAWEVPDILARDIISFADQARRRPA